MKTVAWITLFSIAALCTAAVAAQSADRAVPDLHATLINYLQGTDDVLPRPFPDRHPVSAVENREAIIPPQCYTQTEGRYNPCYVCHQNAKAGRENTMNDGALQLDYSFSDVGLTNRWTNLFRDRTRAVSAITENAILAWVEQDNYSALPKRLKEADFGGWIPDLRGLQEGKAAFDAEGFARDGSHWVAFNYKPLPSTFWPTNGSTDDIMIRLPEAFRQDVSGRYSRDIYKANLAIVEANIKNLEHISVTAIDETAVGFDLDGDGNLSVTHTLRRPPHYVGAARPEFSDTYLYPEGTEFLHTVRYLGFDADGHIVPSRRIKEVRYMRKAVAYRKSVYQRYYQLEAYAKEVGRLPQYAYLGDRGLDNGSGWALQGFIEGRSGALRALTYEENLQCMGCHSSVGATIDKTFGLPRKVDGAAGWGYINLRGMPDVPNRGETRGEIAIYLERVGGGGEFRSNPEMQRRWFKPGGEADISRIAAAPDVYALITPSRERALQLNKAYKVIVDEQSFVLGRDATVTPPVNVYAEIDNAKTPTLPPEKFVDWDIRLDWGKAGEQLADDFNKR